MLWEQSRVTKSDWKNARPSLSKLFPNRAKKRLELIEIDSHDVTTISTKGESSIRALSAPVRDTPHIAQYLLEIVSQSGYRTRFAFGIAKV